VAIDRLPGTSRHRGVWPTFFGRFKRDDVYQACLETLEEIGGGIAGEDRPLQPGGAVQRLENAIASRALSGVVSQDIIFQKLSGTRHVRLSRICLV
jgi:hypothetical protein